MVNKPLNDDFKFYYTVNKAPIVEGMKKLEVMVGQAVTATYTFSDPDPGQTARLVVKSSPPGAVIVEDTNSMTLTWTPTNTEEVTLRYVMPHPKHNSFLSLILYLLTRENLSATVNLMHRQ